MPGTRTTASVEHKLGTVVEVKSTDGGILYGRKLTAYFNRPSGTGKWTLDHITMSASRYKNGPFSTFDNIGVDGNPYLAEEVGRMLESVDRDCANRGEA